MKWLNFCWYYNAFADNCVRAFSTVRNNLTHERTIQSVEEMQPIFAICQEEAIVASAEQSVNRSVPGFYTGESHHLQKSEWFFSLREQSQDLEIPEQFKTTKSVERLVLQRMWQRAVE
ncbi:hypothetical protein T4B_11957 [Trichinella pseudospiralis]|uniref:Uncharacterized protein n=1 Tax=Trichinella pseudospiralis TaxID=6337 RepID=A0A0V1JJ76_TRIPS|nr:hypothetical protein T4B_11957 [Trichinella pseudospiralis]